MAAELTPGQRAVLADTVGVRRIWTDSSIEVSARRTFDFGETPPSSEDMLGAGSLHALGVTGYGVTLAVLDTGFYAHRNLVTDPSGRVRACWLAYDAIEGQMARRDDENGHGGHVTSVAASSGTSTAGFEGIAPDVDLVSVRALEADGRGTYADVIHGIDWIVANKDAYGIRECSICRSAPSLDLTTGMTRSIKRSMAAWQAGIVVVTAARKFRPGADDHRGPRVTTPM